MDLCPDAHHLPPASFSSLPDIAHNNIAAFLSDGSDGGSVCLRISGLSRALLDSYGGSLVYARICHGEFRSFGRLAALLRRQTKLKRIDVNQQKTLPALSQAIAQGCCREVQTLIMREQQVAVSRERFDAFAAALEVERALFALQALTIAFDLTPGLPSKLARALSHGSAPNLQHLGIGFSDGDLSPVVDMLEARAKLPGCRKLKTFGTNRHSSFPIQKRLLRVLLPALEELSLFSWKREFEPCFVEAQPQYLVSLRMYSVDSGESVPSREVLEAMPVLKVIHMKNIRDRRGVWPPIGAGALEPITACVMALVCSTSKRSAFQDTAWANGTSSTSSTPWRALAAQIEHCRCRLMHVVLAFRERAP